MAWTCSCGYQGGDYDIVCSKCGAEKPGYVQTTLGDDSAGPTLKRRGGNIGGRYKDGYRVAAALVAFGTVLKAIGIIGAALTVLAGIAAGQTLPGGLGIISGMLAGGLWFALFFVLGILVAAQGQILKATLDSAVNSSPFLTDDEKAVVLDVG